MPWVGVWIEELGALERLGAAGDGDGAGWRHCSKGAMLGFLAQAVGAKNVDGDVVAAEAVADLLGIDAFECEAGVE